MEQAQLPSKYMIFDKFSRQEDIEIDEDHDGFTEELRYS